MQEISAKILRYRITHSNIYVSPNLPKTFEVSMEGKANLKTSEDKEDKEDKRVLLNVGLDIRKGEELKIEFVADFIFELGSVLENYDEITEKQLIPMARESLLNSLDEMLRVMGYSTMELAKKCGNEG